MSQINRFRNASWPTAELSYLPYNRALRLRNVTCPYCGVEMTAETRTKDHVIGRRFVPKGLLADCWNLLLNACRGCNNRKSDLEDDISAITMLPDLLGRPHMNHPQRTADAASKAINAISRRTGKRVADSRETMEMKVDLGGGATLTFNMVCQPQIDEVRAYELARMHFARFFYLITYDQDRNRGFFWKGQFAPVLMVARADWGNPRARAFMDMTCEWEPRVLAGTAEGFFWIAIRKSPTADVWSLALEWNGNYRVLAACGEEGPLRAFVDALPKLRADSVLGTPDNYFASRIETPLGEADDTLFGWYHDEIESGETTAGRATDQASQPPHSDGAPHPEAR